MVVVAAIWAAIARASDPFTSFLIVGDFLGIDLARRPITRKLLESRGWILTNTGKYERGNQVAPVAEHLLAALTGFGCASFVVTLGIMTIFTFLGPLVWLS